MTHVRILQAFNMYHAYGDDQGLTPEEVAAYDERFGENRVYALPDTEEEFARCELTGFMGATMIVQVMDDEEE